jgi:CBS domain-containing protein
MLVSECMSAGVQVVSPQDTIAQAACIMRDGELGFLPVRDKEKLVGILTDRDMVLRAVAHEKGPATLVREVMSKDLLYCFDADDLDDAAQKMADNQVRRLPVLNQEMRLIGVISLADIAQAGDQDRERVAETLTRVTEAGGLHAH